LISPEEGPPIAGLQVPQDLYWVLRSPAPLAGMRLPSNAWPGCAIHAGGFSDLVSLHPGEYSPAPLTTVFAEQLEDLAGGGPPRDAEREVLLIQKAVHATVQSLKMGRGVVVHCWGGRGRTGTVLGCALRELGYDADVIIDYLDRIHVARGTSGWPESFWQAEAVNRWSADG
jgi:hypothetical protein